MKLLLRPVFCWTTQSRLLLSVNCIRSSSHYEVLRVAKTAKPDNIKKAYIQLCKEFHPDVNTDPEAVVKFREIKEAYEILGNVESKRKYDRTIRASSKFRKHFERQQRERDLTDRRAGEAWAARKEKFETREEEDPFGIGNFFSFKVDTKDPLNINSEKYRRWESRFFRIFPSKWQVLQQLSIEDKHKRLRRLFALSIFLIFQVTIGVLLWKARSAVFGSSNKSDS